MSKIRNIAFASLAAVAAATAASAPAAAAPAAQSPTSSSSGATTSVRRISAPTPGSDGLQDAQHRPRRPGRHDLHRLLRRAKLHRRPRVVHHRPVGPAHRVDQGRSAGRDRRAAQGRPDHRRAAEGVRLRHRARSARTTSATATNFCRPYTASTSSTALCITSTPGRAGAARLSEGVGVPALSPRFGPRGILECKASATDDATLIRASARSASRRNRTSAPLTKKRMETIDDDIATARSTSSSGRLRPGPAGVFPG